MVGLGTSGYQTDQFDNLSVTQVGSATPTGPIVAGDDTADCVDANGGSSANGTKIQMWALQRQRQLTVLDHGEQRHRQHQRQCLDITSASYRQRRPDRGVDLQRGPQVVGTGWASVVEFPSGTVSDAHGFNARKEQRQPIVAQRGHQPGGRRSTADDPVALGDAD